MGKAYLEPTPAVVIEKATLKKKLSTLTDDSGPKRVKYFKIKKGVERNWARGESRENTTNTCGEGVVVVVVVVVEREG